MEIEIENGIELTQRLRYPFDELRKDQSFIFKAEPYTANDRRNGTNLARYHSEKTKGKKKFISRPDKDGNIRVWRTI